MATAEEKTSSRIWCYSNWRSYAKEGEEAVSNEAANTATMDKVEEKATEAAATETAEAKNSRS